MTGSVEGICCFLNGIIYGSKAYHKEDLVINVGGTCSYYASFICRKDHPSLKIMQETFIDFQKKNSK